MKTQPTDLLWGKGLPPPGLRRLARLITMDDDWPLDSKCVKTDAELGLLGYLGSAFGLNEKHRGLKWRRGKEGEGGGKKKSENESEKESV